ncbi:Ring finger domain-containing protein [Hamiltosporidium magnivora]|uniref:Ring finger domain-containing protein n=2 Tax=Hamiltosporidium magnivora TaxID=148818 RepID=A0A4Q9L7R3_9MICR|nr:Ring finger domain-containing protein [Hamiltosporidium magnivora]
MTADILKDKNKVKEIKSENLNENQVREMKNSNTEVRDNKNLKDKEARDNGVRDNGIRDNGVRDNGVRDKNKVQDARDNINVDNSSSDIDRPTETQERRFIFMKEEDNDIKIEHKQNIEDDDNMLVLKGKPVSMQRRVTIARGPGGIPILREIIIIETEASISSILRVLGVLFLYALLFQTVFSLWNKFHKKSCKFTIFGILWLFPPLFSIFVKDYIFFFLCASYSILILQSVYKILKKPMPKKVPRDTYKLFRSLFFTSYIGVILGHILVIGSLFKILDLLGLGIIILAISLYFGLLSREIIDVLSEIMAVNLGYYSKDGMPEKALKNDVCSICDTDFSSTSERTHTLVCGHSFHELCIKGWCFISSKEFCPCCREKVDFKSIPADLWQKSELFFSYLLDILRSFIVFCLCVVVMTMYYKIKQ